VQIDIGFHFLVVHNVDLNEWCDRYDLETFWGVCGGCKRRVFVDQPFVAKKRRGLVASPCLCGSEHAPFSYIDIGYDEINLNFLDIPVESSTPQASQETSAKVRPALRLLDSSGC